MNVIFKDTSIFSAVSEIVMSGLSNESQIDRTLVKNMMSHSLGFANFESLTQSSEGIQFEELSIEQAFDLADMLTERLCVYFYDILEIKLFHAIHQAITENYEKQVTDLDSDAFHKRKFGNDLVFYSKIRAHMILTDVDHLGLTYYFKQNFETNFESVAVQLKQEQGYDLIAEMIELDNILLKIADTMIDLEEAA